MLLVFFLISCGRKPAALRVAQERQEFEEALARFIAYRLEPAKVAPPTLSPQGGLVIKGDLEGTARLVQAEDEGWNDWNGEGPRLLNNTMAHWFQVEIRSRSGLPVRWLPSRTSLELNEPGNVLQPAATQEELLEELLFFAYQQERQVLEGDLVERIRGGGQLRAAYIDAEWSQLQGLIAFPLTLDTSTAPFLAQGGMPADYHVVSMRLTVAVETPRGVEELVWMFE